MDAQNQPKTKKRRYDAKRLFVVDKDTDALIQARGALEERFFVATFMDPTEALTQSKNQRPDAILIDMNMPNFDICEILTMLLEHPVTGLIPIFGISSKEDGNIRERFRQMGGAGFIQKPYDLPRLDAAVNTLLSSLNYESFSRDDLTRCYTLFSDVEKYRYLRRGIAKEIFSKTNEGVTPVLLTWLTGKDFCEAQALKDAVDTDKLLVLEMKPALILKFPFLQDLSPIFAELNNFIKRKPDHRVHLFFDELRNLLNVYDPERALAKAYELAKMLRSSFYKVSIYNSQPSGRQARTLLNKIVRILTLGDAG